MKKTLLGWSLWLGVILILCGVDYGMRLRDGNLLTGELAVPVQSTALLIVAPFAAFFLFKGATKISSIWLRFLLVVGQVIVGLYAGFWILLIYICSAGIDCM